MPDRELRTRRLLLRPLEASDAEELHALWTEEPVRRFLWDGVVVPLEQTREIVAKSAELFDEHGVGLWACRRHEGKGLVAFAGYQFFRTPPELELLFGVRADEWGQGLAAEAAHAVIEYGFDVARFDRIVASADHPNAASLRVLDKLGMKLERRAVVDGLDTCFYSLCRDAWDGLP